MEGGAQRSGAILVNDRFKGRVDIVTDERGHLEERSANI